MVFTGSQSRSIEVAIQGDASSLRSAVNGAQSGLMNLRNAARVAGGALAALSVGGIAKSTQAAAELETAFAEVSTLMGEGQDAADVFGSRVTELSNTFAAQGGELGVVNGLYDVYSAGIRDADAATGVLEQSLKAATAGLTDTRTAADAITTVLNGYNLSASEAQRVSDTFFQTIREGKTRFEPLASTIGRVVPTAAEMGVQFEEVGAALATLTARGQSTDQAVTAVNRTLTSLLKPTNEAAEVIDRMGFESGRALVEQEGLAGALEAVQQHADTSSDELTDVFRNVRALRAVLPLANEASEDFNDNLDAMADNAGVTDEAFEEMADTTEFRFRQALNRLKSTMTETGDTFLPTVTDMLDAINDLVSGFNDLNRATDGVAGQLALVSGVALGAGVAFGGAAGLIAAAGAAAFTAWSQDLAGIKSTTERTVDDIKGSLAELSDETVSETDKQIGFWQRWGIRLAGVIDEASVVVMQLVDDVTTAFDLIESRWMQFKRVVKAVSEGEVERAQRLRQEGKRERAEIWEREQEEMDDRFSDLERRQKQRRDAIRDDMPVLLPRGDGRSGDPGGIPGPGEIPGVGDGGDGTGAGPPSGGGEAAADQFSEDAARIIRKQEEMIAELKNNSEYNRRTADATQATLGGGPCDLREHLLDPLERAPRPRQTDATVGPGVQSAAQRRVQRGAQAQTPGGTGAMITSGQGQGFGSADAASNLTVEMNVDGKKLSEENERVSRKFLDSVNVVQ